MRSPSSPRTLVLLLIDAVSRGGNLLLDIGPDGHGKIPPIMQERLLGIGEWLGTSGEAIFGTRPWKTPVQWSEGNRDYKPKKKAYLGGDFILKQTVDPEPGYAVKEVFFTRKGVDLYAIAPRWPKGKLHLKGLAPSTATTVSLLGSTRTFAWSRSGDGILIEVPSLGSDELSTRPAYAFKVTAVEPAGN
jgi:alpha-L-fucosidase